MNSKESMYSWHLSLRVDRPVEVSWEITAERISPTAFQITAGMQSAVKRSLEICTLAGQGAWLFGMLNNDRRTDGSFAFQRFEWIPAGKHNQREGGRTSTPQLM